MKLSSFVVALVAVGIIMATLGYFITGLATEYSVPYDNTSFAAYNQLSSIQPQIEELNSSINSFNPQNPVDIIGGFFSGGWAAVKIVQGSFDSFTAMGDDAFDKVADAGGNGAGFNIIRVGLYAIVTLIFLFLFISILLGRDV